jgi:hypothetical protein
MAPGKLTKSIKACTSPEELMSLVDQHGQDFNNIHCAAVLSHAAQRFVFQRQGCQIPRSDIERMVQLALKQLTSMDARGLANTAYALAKLQLYDRDFMTTLLEAATPRLHNFEPHELANTVWALASLGHADDAFVAALLKVAAPQLHRFKPQSLGCTAWALLKLGHKDGDFMAALVKSAALYPSKRGQQEAQAFLRSLGVDL